MHRQQTLRRNDLREHIVDLWLPATLPKLPITKKTMALQPTCSALMDDALLVPSASFPIAIAHWSAESPQNSTFPDKATDPVFPVICLIQEVKGAERAFSLGSRIIPT